MIEKIPTTKEIQNFNMKIYSPTNQLIGTVHNELQLLYVQAQIAKEKLEGYYAISNGETFTISEDGRIVNSGKLEIKNSMDSMLREIFGF